MQMSELFQLGAPLLAGQVHRILDDAIIVRIGVPGQEISCTQLHIGREETLRLFQEDPVLIALTDAPGRKGVIVGRIGPARHEPASDIPDELVLEAASNLTLRCGEGSITLRRDGKVLIKGRHLVSMATESQRIKGGSVAIN